MSQYRLSGEADRDIEAILGFTADRWGFAQAERYGAELHVAFEAIVEHPGLGRRIDHIRVGYRRFERGSHSIYYRALADGVIIMRVLHRRMLPQGRV